MSEKREQALSDAKSALELSNRVPYQAIELADSALTYARWDDEETNAYAYAALGSSYASLGRFEEANRHINEAQRLAFEQRLTYVMARIHQARGWVAFCQGNSVTAFSDWQIAFDYFQQIRDLRGTAWILMHYAANYHSLGLVDHSIRCQISALELVSILDDSATLIDLWISLAKSYVAKSWQKALIGEKGFSIFDAQIATSIILKVLDGYFDRFAPIAIEQAFHTLGEAFLIQDRPADALQNLKIALNSSTRSGHYSSEARIQGAIGYAYYLCDDYEHAKEFLTLAIETAPEATPTEDLALIHLWQSLALEGIGDQSAALGALRKSAELEQQAQQNRMERWAKVHDMTLGIGQALVTVESIAEQENGWIFTENQLRGHSNRVETMLLRDPLTDTLNREVAVKTATEQSLNHAAIFDIRNIETINLKFGRAVGDEALRNIASVIAATMPQGSVVGRYSGGEFYVASKEDRFEEAERALRNFPWLAIDPELSISVSVRRVQPLRPHLLAA